MLTDLRKKSRGEKGLKLLSKKKLWMEQGPIGGDKKQNQSMP